MPKSLDFPGFFALSLSPMYNPVLSVFIVLGVKIGVKMGSEKRTAGNISHTRAGGGKTPATHYDAAGSVHGEGGGIPAALRNEFAAPFRDPSRACA